MGGVAIKAIFSGIWGFLKGLPWQVWAALAAAIIVWRMYDYHVDRIEQAYSNGDAAGYGRAMEEVRIKAEDIRRKAEDTRRKAEKASDKIVQEVQDAREQAAADARARGDALSLRWQREAQDRANRSAANLPGVSGAGASTPTGPALDAGLVAVPRTPLLAFGVSHDTCQVNIKAWESWYDRHKKLYDNWQPPPER